MAFIDAHRQHYGVEPICAQLPMAPSMYYEHKARQTDPSRLPPRLQRDRQLEGQIRRVRDENFQVYGVRKTWRALKREDVEVARCSVARLMVRLGLRGAVRGRAFKTTTVSDAALARPADRVQRNFATQRPDALWVSDLISMGPLVQTPPAARTDRIHSTGVEGSCTLSSAGAVARIGMTQPKRSPEKPGRFNPPRDGIDRRGTVLPAVDPGAYGPEHRCV